MSSIFSTTRSRKAFKAIERFLDSSSPGIQGYAKRYLKSELLRKAKFRPDGSLIDEDALHEEALCSFLTTEARLAALSHHSIDSARTTVPIAAVIHTARRKIAELIGEWDFERVTKGCGFSGGSSTRLKRRDAAPANKFVGRPHVTPGCLPVITEFVRRSPIWADALRQGADGKLDVCLVPGNEFFTVDKSATARRPACKEPELNMFIQKGLGDYFRRSLRKVQFDPGSKRRSKWKGINLDTQEWNAEFAFEASFTGQFATIDLSAASDSISMTLIDKLFDEDWFSYISMIRSPLMTVPKKGGDEVYLLHKVSTMGNGFTFELESLIFWALTSSVVDLMRVSDRRVAVFGDDILCHSEAAPVVCEVLEAVGFIPNQKKTHMVGPFRESCGAHYYNGYDVTPFNVTDPLDSAQEVAHLINRLRQWGVRTRIDTTKVVKYLLSLYRDVDLPVVPAYLGTKAGLCVDSTTELMLHGSVSLERPSKNPRLPYYCSLRIKAFMPENEARSGSPEDGRYLAYLYNYRNDRWADRWVNLNEQPSIGIGEMVSELAFQASLDADSEPEVRVVRYRKRWHSLRWWKECLYYGPLPSLPEPAVLKDR